jgi:hypothetical protein
MNKEEKKEKKEKEEKEEENEEEEEYEKIIIQKVEGLTFEIPKKYKLKEILGKGGKKKNQK